MRLLASRTIDRRGFLMMEVLITLAIFGIALILTAQLATFAIAEQSAAHERLTAIEFADNLLESARARTWAELTPEWAAAQQLPADWADRVSNPRLVVRVEAEPEHPRLKRVTIEVRWDHRFGMPARPVVLTALFADRGGGGGS
jgi:prepilin-type N-terminal cleavage/methylation domain-containing protein